MRAVANLVSAVAQRLASGETVVVVDNTDDRTTGVLVRAAEHATPSSMAFIVRHTSGLLCAAMPAHRLDALGLPPMTAGPGGPHTIKRNAIERGDTQFRVAVDAARGVTTGINAADRARTMRVLADPSSAPTDLIRPGHVLPVQAAQLAKRAGPAQATVALMLRAGLAPVGVMATVTTDDGELPSPAHLEQFAAVHGLASPQMQQLVEQDLRDHPPVRREATARLPTRHGEFITHGYRDLHSGPEYLAAVLTNAAPTDVTSVHLHHECLVGDALGSVACQCRDQLDNAMAQIASQGQGVLVYLRPPPLTAGARRPPVLGLRHDKRALTDFPVDAIVMAIIRDLGIPELVALDYPSVRCRSGLRQHLVDTDLHRVASSPIHPRLLHAEMAQPLGL